MDMQGCWLTIVKCEQRNSFPTANSSYGKPSQKVISRSLRSTKQAFYTTEVKGQHGTQAEMPGSMQLCINSIQGGGGSWRGGACRSTLCVPSVAEIWQGTCPGR